MKYYCGLDVSLNSVAVSSILALECARKRFYGVEAIRRSLRVKARRMALFGGGGLRSLSASISLASRESWIGAELICVAKRSCLSDAILFI
jgi:hypothetical protein